MGTGFAVTGGVAVARPLGEWNVGFGGVGAAFARRTSRSTMPGESFRFSRATNIARASGVDHPFGYGRVALGVTYSAFGG